MATLTEGVPKSRAGDLDNLTLKIFEHVDLKLVSQLQQTTAWLDAHEKHEMSRYHKICEEISEGRSASEARHSKLLENLSVYMEKVDAAFHAAPCPHLQDAIPDRDFIGHRLGHAENLVWDSKIKELKWFVVRAVVVAATIATSSWLGILAWNGFLNGPKI